MAANLEDLLATIDHAGDAGLSLGAIRAKFIGKSGAKATHREAELRGRLADLIAAGTIWGPLKHRGSQYYFAAGRGPSVEAASRVVAKLVSRSGAKLLSRPSLAKKVTGMAGRFFADGLKHAVAAREILELTCGTSKYYLHRDVAAEYLALGQGSTQRLEAASTPPEATAELTLETLLPAYRTLKAEQGGFSAVKISDLIRALDADKENLHRLLIAETKAGRMTIHPTTSVAVAPEVADAGIRLPGFSELFVTVVIKNEA